MFEERWFQNEAVFSMFDYFERGNSGNPIIAMPGGTGKSVVLAKIITKVFQLYPFSRVMMLTHDKRLIQQNAEKLMQLWPVAPLGIYSAGLNSRDMILPIVFGGIQSVDKAIKRSEKEELEKPFNFRHFGHRDLVFIDEAHLIGPDEASMYLHTFAELKKINPFVKFIGLSASPYRTKEGLLTDGGLFTHTCYDITDVNSFARLMAEGYIMPILPKPTNTFLDLSGVGVGSKGEYNQKQASAAVDKAELNLSACKEMVEGAYNRNAWLVFAQDTNHAEHLNEILQSMGIVSTVVHSKIKDSDKRIADYKGGFYQCMVNNNMLTTGFDHPPIDFIGDCQPTMSPGKHVQKWFRGTRPSPATGKINCLGYDFARNIRNMGPINDPKIPRKKGQGKAGDAPVRLCEQCGVYNRAAARECFNCGCEFSFKTKLFAEAGTLEIIKSESPIIEILDVARVIYNLHEKKGSPPMIKVTYFVGFKPYVEFVCLEHPRAAHFAREWWRQRHNEEPPPTTHEALKKINQLRMPKRIRVHVNKNPHPEILGHEY